MKTLLLITLALVLTGCTLVEYEGARYMSIGGKEFESLNIVRQDNGDIRIEINKYRKEGVSDIVEGAVRGAIRGFIAEKQEAERRLAALGGKP